MDNGLMETNSYENSTAQFQKTSSRMITFIVSIIILIIATLINILSEVLVTRLQSTLFTAYGFGRITGAIIGSGIVVSIIFFLIFRFKSVNIRANLTLIFSILFLLFQISSFVGSANTIIKVREQETATQVMLTQMIKNVFLNKKIDKQDFSEEKYGVNARSLTMSSEWFNKILDEKAKFEAKVSSLGADSYLNEEGLSSKESINNSIDELEHLKVEINNYERSYNKNIKEFGDSISNLDVPKAYKDSALAGYNNAIKNNKARTDEFFIIERDFCDNYIDLLEFLNDSFDKFEVQDDICTFYEQGDADAYNELVDSLNHTVEKEAGWIKENEQRKQDLVKKNEELTKRK